MAVNLRFYDNIFQINLSILMILERDSYFKIFLHDISSFPPTKIEKAHLIITYI